MPTDNREEFICEQIIPVAGTADVAAMTRREPGVPKRFCWRGTEYRLAGVIRKWKTMGPDVGGGREMYVRRHWYKILTEPPAVMTIYFDRQAKDRKRPKARWWIYSASLSDSPGS